MSELSEREVAIFNAARRLAGSERTAYLDQTCAGDAALRQRLDELLRVEEPAGDFLEKPGYGHTGAAAIPGGTIPLSAALSEKPGDRIGRYKLLEQIGEGGCGVVYMAEQEEPVRRRVALKVIKLGMDTRSVIARFEAERQALALMDHPNIAKVLDAGATETGRPYFVMELIKAIPITRYCDENNLSTVTRLGLFVQVCQAVQHAHQKGIIHRDIKPSNILVADHDGVAVPKIIDFGIAKATTDQRLTDKTVFTAFEQFIGTPAYMSPEQAKLSGLDIDTRTDIYSLGVLLYELLTGKTPFEAKRFLEAGLDEIRRIIREDEPVRPSTRLQTLGAAEQTTVAKLRQSEPPKLLHLIQGDLDWIVMKCLEKDRSRRYETANGLALDVQRHLNNEPVVASPPGNLYRLQKLVRRNKTAFTAVAGILTVLVLGVVVSTIEAIRARQAEREQIQLRLQAQAHENKARTEAAKATAISAFFQQSLRAANPDERKGSDYTVRQLLDDYSQGLKGQFTNQPEVEVAVRETIGKAYYRLGAGDKAQAHLERALALQRQLYGEHEQVAATLADCAWAAFEQGQHAKAELQARRALEIYRQEGTVGQPVLFAMWALQEILNTQGRFADAEAVGEQALDIARKTPGVEYPETASITHVLAESECSQSRYAQAEVLARKALEMHRRLQGSQAPEAGWALLVLGRSLQAQRKLGEAERAYREALSIFRSQYSGAYKNVNEAVDSLNALLGARGGFAELVALDQTTLANQRLSLGNDSPVVAGTLSTLADHLQAQGKLTEAEQAYRDALAIYTKLGTVGSGEFSAVVRSLRELLKLENKPAEIETLYSAVISLQRSVLGADSPNLALSLFGLGNFFKSQNRPVEASQKYRESLDILFKPNWEEHVSILPWWVVPELMEVGDKRQATDVCKAMLSSNSTNGAWFNGVAWYLATTENPLNRNPAVAIELAKRAVKINPGGDWNTVGVAYYRIGDFKQAVEALAKQVQIMGGGGSSTDFFFQAMAEHQVGHAEAARRYYLRAVQWMNDNAPQDPELLRFRAEAERLLGPEAQAGTETQIPATPAAK